MGRISIRIRRSGMEIFPRLVTGHQGDRCHCAIPCLISFIVEVDCFLLAGGLKLGERVTESFV
eukprot:scaffold18336_cov24-Tisochrysis_lutea.AAC.1